MNSSYSKRRLSGLVSTLVLVAALGLGWLFRQDISDWWRLRDYQAPAEIAALAEQTTMTSDGRQQFYVTHPQITDEEAFNANCRQGGASEYSIVLGCYISNGGLYGSMYLFDIDDERLSGIMQVTAAHEMLHAAYDRLDADEKQRIDTLLEETYQDLPAGRIKETIAQYEANDPGSVPSELHSILGTELRDLPQELEDYYRQYFSNRLKVVAYSEQYEAEFTRRQNQVDRYDQQLASLKATIEANQAEIQQRIADLEQQQAQLNDLRASGNTGAYNAQVSQYNQGVAAYNALVQTTRSQIDEYNNLVEVRNGLALEVQALIQAIDSRPETL